MWTCGALVWSAARLPSLVRCKTLVENDLRKDVCVFVNEAQRLKIDAFIQPLQQLSSNDMNSTFSTPKEREF